MTSDAKIGLLLGLVFIFIIAFLINGLPSFNGRNNSELTTNVVGLQNNPPGLAARERKKVQEIFNSKEVVEKERLDEGWPPPVSEQDIRSVTPLPKNTPIVKTTDEVKPSKPSLPKFYVVVDGDNLAVIAKKFYGDEEGNRMINVTRIFQANRKLLGSLDEIYVGQKVIIPPLAASAPDKSKTENVFSTTILEKAKSIGQRYLSSDGRKVGQGKQYVVREGDSLWKIAAEQLGDGSRYTEIAKLNGDILDDEDTLFIGMRLKMPARK
jgi:nucleoid-associated protein YgaU